MAGNAGVQHLRGTIRFGVVALAALLPFLTGLVLESASATGTVTVSVQGSGDVTGEGIACHEGGGDCSEYLESVEECSETIPGRPPVCTVMDPVLVLTAGPDRGGFTFREWRNCDRVEGRECSVTVDGDVNPVAVFGDVQQPSVGALSPARGVHRGVINVSVGASDNVGVHRVEFHVRGAPIGTDTTAPYAVSFDSTAPGVSDGVAALTAKAYDAAGTMSSSSSTITIDNTSPTVSVTSGPDGQTFGPGSAQTWMFTVGDATSLVTAACSLVAAGQPASFGPCSGGAGSHTVTNLAEGSYAFQVKATDAAGNIAESATRSFSIDTTAPTTSITKSPRDLVRTTTRQARVSFGFASNEVAAQFQCRMDANAWAACTSPKAFRVGKGSHTFKVRAIDAAGNRDATPASRTFRVIRS